MIPLSVPNFAGNELKYVSDAIETEWVSTGGSYINTFEMNIAKYVGVGSAVACQSGTAGLHIAEIICGVEKGDLIIVPTLTFIAAVNPVKYVGASPIFMDCDESLCIDPVKLRNFCENQCEVINNHLYYKKTSQRISCVVVVHILGNMADMDEIISIAHEYKLKVIEDATEALGTKYLSGKFAGKYAGTIGDVGVYSFNGNKIITCGGGGMLVSNDKELMARAKHLTTQAKSDELYYEHDEIGYNYRMTNLQAALGVAQLENLEKFINIKNANYELYRELLSRYDSIELLDVRKDIRSNRWFYSLYLKDDAIDRDAMINYLLDNGIQVRPIWGLIHEQKPYLDDLKYNIEIAVNYRNKVINVPCSTNLRKEDIEFVVSKISNYG